MPTPPPEEPLRGINNHPTLSISTEQAAQEDASEWTHLLALWEDACACGRELSAEELCPNHPERAPEVRRWLETIRLARQLRMPAPAPPAGDEESGPTPQSPSPDPSGVPTSTRSSAPPTGGHLPPSEAATLDGWTRPPEPRSPEGDLPASEAATLDGEHPGPGREGTRGTQKAERFPILPLTLGSGSDGSAPESAGVCAVPGYEILGELGRGGMGVVYKARQVRIDRLVALKMVLAGGHAGEIELARFRTEAEAIARLDHPNIVQIHEVGEHEGKPFFSLEFCPGGSLDKKLAGTPLPPREGARLVETLAQAVQVAHDAHVVHRDLKPANVLLLADGTPKITDFGLAKKLDDVSQTQSGAIMGTPSYMAPEQAGGKNKDVGPAVDVYALGAMLYEMLTGRPPFKAATVMETLQQVLADEPVPPHRLQPHAPRDLETICLKCLEKDPARRYAAAADLARDLRCFLAGETIQARPAGAGERAVKWAKRRPAAAALVLMSAAAVAGLLGLSIGFNAHLKRAVDQARHDEQEARREADAVKASQQLSATQSACHELLARGETAFAAGDQARTREHLAAASLQLNDDPSLAGLRDRAQRLRAALDNLERFRTLRFDAVTLRFDADIPGRLDTGEDAQRHADKARELAREALRLFGVTEEGQGPPVCRGPFHANQAAEINAGCSELLLVWADALARPLPGQNAGQRRERLLQACAVLDRANRLGPRPTHPYHLQRARYLADLGDAAAAKREQDLAAARPPETALDHFLAGNEYHRRNDLPQAVRAFETALRLQPDLFWARYFSAVCYLKENRLGEAVGSLTACVLQRPDFLWVYLLRGFAHGQMGEFAAAEADFRKAQDLRPDPEAAYALLVNRGAMRYRQGNLAAAVEDFQQAVRLRPGAYQAHLNLGRSFQKQQKSDQALAAFARAVACDPGQPVVYRARAGLFQERRDLPAAAKDLDQAVRLERNRPDRQAADLAGLYAERGRIRALGGKHADALADYEAALKLLPVYPDVQIHRWRGESLLVLDQDADAVVAFDRYLATRGKPAAAVYRSRGLAQARLGKHLSAIEDYTLALRLSADAATHLSRGWEYALVVHALRLALADFEEAVRLRPDDGEAYYGRGYTRVKLHRYKEGLADVRTALEKGPRSSRLLCVAARAYAQAAAGHSPDALAQNRRALTLRTTYLAQSVELLDQALAAKPAADRAALWRTLRADRELSPLAGLPAFLRLEARYSGLTNTANARK